MRNLKRALSLALASVMVLGLMVVGSGASYKDVSSEQNQEAIEVLQAVGIMVGDDNGNFNPQANVTRNEMAVIMSNLMDYRVSSYAGTSPFTDVPAWAEPYVAACWTNGITSGYTATTYGGSDTVTTAQAALMLMKALGYFQYASDFGDDWQLATVKQANKIDLFDDVASGVREAMTRNDVAQLVLNTLEAGTVEADDDTIKVTTDSAVVEAGSVKYNYITSGKDYAEAVNDLMTGTADASSNTAGYIVELGEKLYQGDLKKRDTSDNFGAPASKWTYKNSEIGTYADKADYVFTGIVKSNAMYDAVGKTAARDYQWVVLMDGTTTPKKADGSAQALFTGADVLDNDKDDLDGTVRGSTTYVYLDDDAYGRYAGTATVCIVNTYVAEITKVTDGTITLDDMDKSGLEFDIEGYEDGQVVLYTKSLSGTTWTVESILGEATLSEGEAETVRETDRVIIDGQTYRYSYRFNDANGAKLSVGSTDQNVAFYLDQQGHIIYMEDASESNDYAYVYSIGDASNKYGDDADYGAKLILTDGTIMKIDIDDDTTDPWVKNVSGSAAKLTAVQDKLLNKIVSYSEEDDGTYSLTLKTTHTSTWAAAAEDVVKSNTSRIALANGSYIYSDKNTAFVINEESADNDDFNAYVGYAAAPDVDVINGSKLVAYVNSKGIAKAVFIVDAEVSGSSKDVVFVVGNPTAAENHTGANYYYVFDAVVDGKATSIKVKSGSDAYNAIKTIAKNEVGIYFGITENSNGYVTKVTTAIPTDVVINNQVNKNNQTAAQANGNYSDVVYTGVQRESTGGNLGFGYSDGSYTMHFAASSEALIAYYDDHDLTVETRVKTDTNDQAYVITDDGEVIAIYVHEKADGNNNNGQNQQQPGEYFEADINGSTITFYYYKGYTINNIKTVAGAALDQTVVNVDTVANTVTMANGDRYGLTLTPVYAISYNDEIMGYVKADGKKTDGTALTFDVNEGAKVIKGKVAASVETTTGDEYTAGATAADVELYDAYKVNLVSSSVVVPAKLGTTNVTNGSFVAAGETITVTGKHAAAGFVALYDGTNYSDVEEITDSAVKYSYTVNAHVRLEEVEVFNVLVNGVSMGYYVDGETVVFTAPTADSKYVIGVNSNSALTLAEASTTRVYTVSDSDDTDGVIAINEAFKLNTQSAAGSATYADKDGNTISADDYVAKGTVVTITASANDKAITATGTNAPELTEKNTEAGTKFSYTFVMSAEVAADAFTEAT